MTTPNPGSREAFDAGCVCPILENEYHLQAFGVLLRAITREENWRVINMACPIHGKEAEDVAGA